MPQELLLVKTLFKPQELLKGSILGSRLHGSPEMCIVMKSFIETLVHSSKVQATLLELKDLLQQHAQASKQSGNLCLRNRASAVDSCYMKTANGLSHYRVILLPELCMLMFARQVFGAMPKRLKAMTLSLQMLNLLPACSQQSCSRWSLCK